MFLPMRASADSGDRSPWGGFWFNQVPWNGSTENITSDVALRLTVVYRCVRLLSESISILPFTLYKPRADGGRTQVTDHWLYRLLAQRPNAFQNPVQWRALMQTCIDLRGNGFSRIVGNRKGEVTDLIPIHPDRVTLEMLDDTNWRYRIRNKDGSETILNRGQMLHLWQFSLDGIIGVNPIRAGAEAIATGVSAQSYGARFFKNNAVPNGWLEVPYKFPDDQTRRNFQARLQESLGGRSQGKVAVFENNEKFNTVQLSNVDAELIASKKFSVSEVARLYGVPPHKVGDLDKATFSNIEQQSQDYVNDAVMPRTISWEAAIAYEFIQDDENLKCEFPFTTLLRGDTAARRQWYRFGIQDGWMNRNEPRIAEGMNPAPGLDEFLKPMNMASPTPPDTTVDPEEKDPSQQDPSEKDPSEQEPAEQKPKPPKRGSRAAVSHAKPGDSRLMALASAAAERVARKEWQGIVAAWKADNFDSAVIEVYNRHTPFVAAVLNVSIEAATDYCAQQLQMLSLKLPEDEFQAIARSRLERLAMGADTGSST